MMDTETQRGWDAWCDARIRHLLASEPFTRKQVEVLGFTISELRAEMREHVAKEIAKLRAEIKRGNGNT